MQTIKPFQLNDSSIFLDNDFTLGVATSSYQIEGAVDVDGRLPSIWDSFSKTAGKVHNGDTGDLACDHYYRYADDIALIKDLGFDAYRFSIAWGRVLDENGQVNAKGLAFYQRLLDEVEKHDLKSYATLYHWDLPQFIDDRGGWLNRDTAYRFADYAEKVMQHLGSRFTAVATINEPWVISQLGYHIGSHAPGHTCEKSGLTAAHHVLLAHGLGLQAIRAECPDVSAGIVLNMAPSYPASASLDDNIATMLDEQYSNDWFIQPILQGKYPTALSREKNELLPQVVDGDMAIISQPIDFLGINYYTRNIIRMDENGNPEKLHHDSNPHTDFDWEVYPQGLTDLLVGLNARYDNLPAILITENGASYGTAPDENGDIDDEARRSYYEQHLNALDNAAKAGVDVRGYFAWSLLDNFEWEMGYAMRFGIVFVDYATQQRTPKHSALAFQHLNQQRKQ